MRFSHLYLVTSIGAIAVPAIAAAQADPPGVFISPPSGTVSTNPVSVSVTWSDDVNLAPNTRVITFNNANVSASFGWTPIYTRPDGAVLGARSDGQVTLVSGTNTLTAYICDPGNFCTSETVQMNYVPPPPPSPYAAPVVSTAPHHDGFRNQAAEGSTLSYTTPGYVSVDQPRGVTLFYSSAQAAPTGFVELEVTDPSSTPAEKFSIRVLSPSGALLTLSNGQTAAYFGNQNGTTGGKSRISAAFDASQLGAPNATGAWMVNVEVTSYWPDHSTATTVPVRVLVVDRRGSPYGAGWTIAGLQRLHTAGSGGVLVDEGNGTARFFAGSTSAGFVAPAGDHSTLTYANSKYTRRYPDGSGAEFNAAGVLLYTWNAAGEVTSFAHDASVRLTTITDPAGLQTTLAYHTGAAPHGTRLGNIQHPGGGAAYFHYGMGAGDLNTVSDSAGVVVLRMYYDPAHRLTNWSQYDDGQWDVTYDAFGELATVTAPQITVGASQQVRPQSTRVSEKVTLLPANGQATSTSPRPRVLADSVYARVTDPRGYQTRVWTDRFGLPVKVVGPLAHTTTIERDAAGQPVRVTDAAGRTVSYNWHPSGMLARSFDAAQGLQVDHAYQTLNGGNFLRRSSEGTAQVEYVRGTSGEVLAVVVGADTVARYTYDPRLRVVTARDKQGHETRFFYDGNARLNTDSVRVNATAANPQTIRFGYDTRGRVISTTAPDGRVTTTTYDHLNRVLKQRAPGDSVVYAYNNRGLYRVTDALGRNYDFSRNVLGWAQSETDTNGRPTSYQFDAVGNVTAFTDRANRSFQFQYDALGRLTSRTTPDAGTTTYSYQNPQGWWIAAQNAESADTVHINSGRVTDVISHMGGVRYTVMSTYRPDGLRSTVTVGATISPAQWWNEQVDFGYDSRLRLTTLTDMSRSNTTVGYNADGLPGTITYPTTPATVLSLGYTPRHELSSATYSQPTVDYAFGTNSLAYDILGRIGHRAEASGNRQHFFNYDAIGRLYSWDDQKLVQEPVPPYCGQYATEPECLPTYYWQSMRSGVFNYDAVGNRTTWTRADSTGANNNYSATLQAGSNRYATFAGWTLTYDSVGNLTRRQNATQDIQYRWNSLGQLTGVYTPATGWIDYFYNGFGVRVRRRMGGVDTRYIYDGDDLIAEVDGSGNRLRTYTYWPGIDQPHSMRDWTAGQGGVTRYYALEMPGSNVRGLWTGSGTVTHQYRYTPYGEPLLTSEATANPLRFAAREYDGQAGLYYVRARWYDPFLGRFISEDPIGLAGGINLYAYTLNDPVNRADPSGLDPECIVRGFHHYLVKDGNWEYQYSEITYVYCSEDRSDDILADMPHHRRWGMPPWCGGGFDAYQCGEVLEAFDELQASPLETCREMGMNGERRLARGLYRFDPNFPKFGYAVPATGVVGLGPAAFLPLVGAFEGLPPSGELQLQTTIAEEEAHHAFGGGHHWDGTFVGTPSPLGAPDQVGFACREGRFPSP